MQDPTTLPRWTLLPGLPVAALVAELVAWAAVVSVAALVALEVTR